MGVYFEAFRLFTKTSFTISLFFKFIHCPPVPTEMPAKAEIFLHA
jgi:hypothetical protein